MSCRIHARSSSSCLVSEIQDEMITDTLDTKSCQKELVESSMVVASDSRSSSHATIEDLEREQESSSSTSSSSSSSTLSSSPSVVTSECCSEVEGVDTLDSESNPSVVDSATDHQEDAANGKEDPEVKAQAVNYFSDPTTSTPSVRDMDTEMINAQ